MNFAKSDGVGKIPVEYKLKMNGVRVVPADLNKVSLTVGYDDVLYFTFSVTFRFSSSVIFSTFKLSWTI